MVDKDPLPVGLMSSTLPTKTTYRQLHYRHTCQLQSRLMAGRKRG
jgi:hypothetical protein